MPTPAGTKHTPIFEIIQDMVGAILLASNNLKCSDKLKIIIPYRLAGRPPSKYVISLPSIRQAKIANTL